MTTNPQVIERNDFLVGSFGGRRSTVFQLRNGSDNNRVRVTPECVLAEDKIGQDRRQTPRILYTDLQQKTNQRKHKTIALDIVLNLHTSHPHCPEKKQFQNTIMLHSNGLEIMLH